MVNTSRSRNRFAWSRPGRLISRSAAVAGLGLALAAGPASAQISMAGSTKTLMGNWVVIGNDIAYDPVNKVYFVVGAYGEVYGMFANTAGDLVAGPFPIGSASKAGPFASYPKTLYSPDLNGGRGGFLVTWHESGAVHSVVVAYPSGVISQDQVISDYTEGGSNGGIRPAIAYSTTSRRFFLAWTTNVWSTQGRFVDASGTPTGAVMPLAPAQTSRDPALSWNQATDHFGLAYSGFGGSGAYVAFQRIRASDGYAFDRNAFGFTGGTFATDVDVNPTTRRYVMGWSVGGGSYGAELDENGTLLETRLISTRMGTPTSFDLAFNPVSSTFLAISEDTLSKEVAATELDQSGTPKQVAVGITDGATSGSFVPRIASRTDAKEWNISLSRNLSSIANQIVATGSAGGGGVAPPPPPACSYEVSHTPGGLSYVGGSGTVTVTTTSGCSWSASSSASWLALGDSGSMGSATFGFAAGPNRTPTTRTATLTVAGRTLTVTQAAMPDFLTDFNGDARSDIVWQNRFDGRVYVWQMQGMNLIGGGVPLGPGFVSDNNWKIMATPDLNRDGYADVLWQHDSGSLGVWYMQGLTFARAELFSWSVPPDWRVVGSGDLDRDGWPDIIAQNTAGIVAVWYLYGTQLRSGVAITQLADSNWRVVAAADFNNDGWLDLVWRHQTRGDNALWFMQDRQRVDSSYISLSMPDTNWQIAGLGDFNADSRPDLIWRHAQTGAIGVWMLNGATVLGGQSTNPSSASMNWMIVGPR
jgi:hypothetical protein